MSEKRIFLIALLLCTIIGILRADQFANASTKPPSDPFLKSANQIPRRPTRIPPISLEKLEKYLTVEAALLGVRDSMSLYLRDTYLDREVSMDPTRSWIPASTIKAFVVLEAFRQKRVGLIDFNQPVAILADNVVPTELETNEFPILREGIYVTIQQLVESMIIQSDNTAYNRVWYKTPFRLTIGC